MKEVSLIAAVLGLMAMSACQTTPPPPSGDYVSADPTSHGPRWDGTYVPPAQRKQEVRPNQLPKLPTYGPHRF